MTAFLLYPGKKMVISVGYNKKRWWEIVDKVFEEKLSVFPEIVNDFKCVKFFFCVTHRVAN